MSIYDQIAQGGRVANIPQAIGSGIKLADMFRQNRIGNATEQDLIEAVRLKNLQDQYNLENPESADGGAQFGASNGVLYNNRTGEYIVLPQEEKQYAPQSPYSIEGGYKINKMTGEAQKLEDSTSSASEIYGQPYIGIDSAGNKMQFVMSKTGVKDLAGNPIDPNIIRNLKTVSPTQYDPNVVSGKAQATKQGENAGEEVVANIKLEAPINQAKTLLGWDEAQGMWGNQPELTSSLLGAARDSSQKLYGGTSTAGANASALETVASWMTASVPRMQGPQSDADRVYYEQMAGKLGDRTAPIEVRRKALEQLIILRQKYNADEQPSQGNTFTTKSGIKYEVSQ